MAVNYLMKKLDVKSKCKIVFTIILVLYISVCGTTSSSNGMVEKISSYLIVMLETKDEQSLQELMNNKESFIEKHITFEVSSYTENLRKVLGTDENDPRIQELLIKTKTKVSESYVRYFSQVSSFLEYLDICEKCEVGRYFDDPVVVNKNDSIIQVVFPYLRWGNDVNMDSQRRLPVWTFTIDDSPIPTLIDIIPDYNFGRTEQVIETDQGNITFQIDQVRTKENDYASFQLSMSILTSVDTPISEEILDSLNAVVFPKSIAGFSISGLNMGNNSKSQMGKHKEYSCSRTYVVDYRKRPHRRTILPTISTLFLGNEYILKNPMVMRRPF